MSRTGNVDSRLGIFGIFKKPFRKEQISTYGGTLRIAVKGTPDDPMYYLSTHLGSGQHALTRDDLLKLAEVFVVLAEEEQT